MRSLVLALAAVLSLASSSTYKPYKAEPATAAPGVTDADLYAAAVRVFTDRGFTLRDNDVDAGVVSTEFIQIDDPAFSSTMHSWRAVVDDGTLRLAIDCVIAEDGKTRRGCGNRERAQHWVDAAPKVRAAILADAKRRAQRRLDKQDQAEAETEAETQADEAP